MAFGDAVERIRKALEEHDCRPRGGTKLRARCPVHESHGPTLAVSQGRAGAVIYCHAQCATRDILDAIGLCMDDLFDEPRQHDEPRFIRKAVTPATGAEMAGRVIVRALRVALGRDLDVWQDRPGGRLSWQGRGPRGKGAGMPGRVIVRALRVALGRDLDVWQDRPGGRLSWQERVQRAEDGCRQDAEAHYWQTMGRWSALACDRAYVQRAYASKAAYEAREPDAQLSHEQAAVLIIRAEDLATGNEVAA